MKKVMMMITLAFAALINMNSYGLDGAGSSGGGDNPSASHNAAWFLGDYPISYCIDFNPNFSLPLDSVKETISAAMKQWKDYILRKNVESIFYNDAPKLNQNYHYQESCNKKTDLTFYIGKRNKLVDEASKNFQNPSAFAHRQSYDAKKMRAKGFIWVAEKVNPSSEYLNWSFKKGMPFYGMILHELGHLIGIEHVLGTIMDKNIMTYLFGPYWIFHPKKIDHYLELFSNDNDDQLIDGLPDMSISKSKDVFELLIGKRPKGEVSAKVSVRDEHEKVFLTLKDSEGEYPLQIKFKDSTDFAFSNFGNTLLKKAWWDDKTKSVQSLATTTLPFVAHGIITDFKGKKHIMLYEYNMINLPYDFNQNENNHQLNPDLNYDEKYSRTYFEFYIFDNLEKKRIFGPSAYWFSEVEDQD
jgi:hypothetical protein